MFHPIPAPNYTLVSGKKGPPDDGTEYHVQLRNGWCDEANRYTARQLVWVHDGSSGDVVAVRKAKNSA